MEAIKPRTDLNIERETELMGKVSVGLSVPNKEQLLEIGQELI